MDEMMPAHNAKWNEATIREAAASCTSRTEFMSKYASAYQVAQKLRITNDVIGYSFNQWDKQSVQTVAILCKSKSELQKRFKGAYVYAHRHKFIDSLFKNQRTYWNEELVRKESVKYLTKIAFYRGASGAYQYANDNGLIDQLFENVPTRNTKDCIYIWEAVNEGSLYKVGITSESLGVVRIKQVAKRSRLESKIIILSNVGYSNAKMLESKIKKLGSHHSANHKFDGYTEFRRFSPSELAACVEMISEHTIERLL